MKKEKTDSKKPSMTNIEALKSMPDSEIDTSNIPEISDMSHFVQGMFHCPNKREYTLRLDSLVVDWFKLEAGRDGDYQDEINKVLWRHIRKTPADLLREDANASDTLDAAGEPVTV